MKKNSKRYIFGSFHLKKICLVLMFPISAMLLFSAASLSVTSFSENALYTVLSLGVNAPYSIADGSVAKAIFRLSLPTASIKSVAKKTAPAQEVETEPPTELPVSPPLPEDNSERVTYSSAAEKGYTSTEGIYINNQTDLSVDVASLLSAPLEFTETDGPLVLIVHTHTSESYTPSEKYNYIPSETDRSQDTNFNMVSVGREVYALLCEAGINTIHDESINDYPSYNGSYNKTLKLIESYTQKYPSIQIVLDIHRDAIVKSDGTKIKVSADVPGVDASQVMLVVGTDQSGLSHPTWKKNMSFALKLQYKMNELYPTLARPVNLRKQRFNQHTAPGALIVEVGTNGNTLDEAKEGAKLFARALIEVLNN